MTIASILRHKGDQVVAVSPHDDAASIARTLAQHRIGAVLVRDASGGVMGIISERDIVRAMARAGEGTAALLAEALMTRELSTVSPRTTITDALAMMTDRRIRHLPVLDEGRLAGMVSIGDLVKARIAQAEDEAESLRTYVATGG
ncbi:CBS domain-containing protein [Roseomonas sp. BN140053]|uniref:CBS domain-containing protein n=1 Tax=Roseomonas sp. BN140053 TaxID=3391898 RepID=UPI0039EB614B